MVKVTKDAAVKAFARSNQFKLDPSSVLCAQYGQFLRAKQRTLMFSGKALPYPRERPDYTCSERIFKKWKQKADLFARHCLMSFQPEIKCHSPLHINNHIYD